MRDQLDDAVEQRLDAHAGLAAHAQHVIRIAADQLGELARVLVRVGGRQVDLVEHRDDREVVLEREVEVRESLRLDALRGVDEQDRALARGERARHLVGEVDVPGGVDHVEGEGLRLLARAELPRHPDGLALDRDAALALDVHAVEVLRAHVAVGDDAGDLQHAVGERRLAVVDVRDDAEVAKERRVGRGRLERREGTGRHVRAILPDGYRPGCQTQTRRPARGGGGVSVLVLGLEPEGEERGDRREEREADDADGDPPEGADEAEDEAPVRHDARLRLAGAGHEAEDDRRDGGEPEAGDDSGDAEHEGGDAESVGGGAVAGTDAVVCSTAGAAVSSVVVMSPR